MYTGQTELLGRGIFEKAEIQGRKKLYHLIEIIVATKNRGIGIWTNRLEPDVLR